MRVMLCVLWPVAKPIAVVLDLLLGSGAKPSTYRRYDTIGDDKSVDVEESVPQSQTP